MKKIINKVKKYLKKSFKYSQLIVALALSLFVFANTAKGEGDEYKPNLKFEQTQTGLIVLEDKKVTIEPGISREELAQLNEKVEPEMVKNLMKQLANEYDVDWKLVYAIGYHESANYSSHLAKNNNNFFGRKARSGGYASWENPEEGIRNQFEYLQNRYFDRGLDTPAKINPVYAEDNTWHVKVESVMSKL
jgi:hypothetical protein